MCCDNKTGAGGALQIWAGEKRLLSRQYLTFNGSMSLIFTVGVLATPSPSRSIAPTSTSWPTSQPTHSRPIVSIEIQFDRHPTEVAWFLTTEDETEILDGRYPGAYDDSLRSGRIVESAFLRPTQGETTYTFVLIDNERDGLCCSGGTGFVRLWLGGVQEGTLLQEFSKYYIETRFTFTVDPTKTSAPTSAPTIRNMTLPGPNATSMAKPKVILETAMLLLTALLMMGLW